MYRCNNRDLSWVWPRNFSVSRGNNAPRAYKGPRACTTRVEKGQTKITLGRSCFFQFGLFASEWAPESFRGVWPPGGISPWGVRPRLWRPVHTGLFVCVRKQKLHTWYILFCFRSNSCSQGLNSKSSLELEWPGGTIIYSFKTLHCQNIQSHFSRRGLLMGPVAKKPRGECFEGVGFFCTKFGGRSF